jgi:flagellar biosynthesis protein FliP
MLASGGRRVRFTTGAASVAALLLSATPLAAQDISINFGQGAATGGGGLNEHIIQLIALMTVLSLAPSILVMMTSFTRIVVVLSLLRTALGTATAQFGRHLARTVPHRLRDGAGVDAGL